MGKERIEEVTPEMEEELACMGKGDEGAEAE